MTNLKFVKVRLENFRKHTNYALELTSQGFVRVEGPNGAGKSSIFEAITWALFGDEGRGSSAASIIKAGTKTAKVSVDIEINDVPITITRERSNTGMTVSVVNDGKSIALNTAKAGQEYIDSLLGLSSGVFGHIVFVKQYAHRYFFELTDSEQKALVESLFELDFLDESLAKFKQLKKSVTTKKLELEKLQETRDAYIRSFTADLQEEKKQLERKDSSIRLNEIEDEISQAEHALKEIDKRVAEEQLKRPELDTIGQKWTEEHAKLNKEYQASIKQHKEVKDQIRTLMTSFSETVRQKDIKKTLENGVCGLCGAKVTKERQKTLEAEISEEDNSEKLDKLNQQEEILGQEAEELREKVDAAKTGLFGAQADIQKFEDDLRELTNGKRFVEQSIKNLTREKAQLQSLKSGSEAKIKHLEDKINSMEESIPYAASLKFDKILGAIDEGIRLFGPLGLRNDVFDKYLQILSNLVNETLVVLLPGTKVDINTESITSTGESRRKFSVEITRDDQFSYFDLSGGERRRLNIAFTLALHSFIEQLGNIRTNILILDEIFDSLDAQGMEMVSELLTTYDKESIFLITHSPYRTSSDNIIVIGDE